MHVIVNHVRVDLPKLKGFDIHWLVPIVLAEDFHHWLDDLFLANIIEVSLFLLIVNIVVQILGEFAGFFIFLLT